MTLNEIVLQKLAEWQSPAGGRQTLCIPDESAGWLVEIAAEDHNTLGCAVWELTVRRTAPPATTDENLAGWANRIASRATGLLEPLTVVEIDGLRNEALLRSKEAARRKNELYYYEILVQGVSQARTRRYRASEDGGRREQVSFTLTHESLARFVSDLTRD